MPAYTKSLLLQKILQEVAFEKNFKNFFQNKMPTLKELKQRARSEGIIGFSRMKKADLEKALQNLQKRSAQKTSFPVVKSLVNKVLPQRISKVVESSIDSMNDWFGKMKKRVDWNLKENFDPWSLLNAFKRKAVSLGVDYINGEAVDFVTDQNGQISSVKVLEWFVE